MIYVTFKSRYLFKQTICNYELFILTPGELCDLLVIPGFTFDAIKYEIQ
jgi:hypothetical protein